MKKLKAITNKEFDRKFDNGEDMGGFLNLKEAKVNKPTQRINIDFPSLLLKKINKEAKKIGIARAALIKMWLADRLEHVSH